MNRKSKSLVVFLLACMLMNSFQVMAGASTFSLTNPMEEISLPAEEELVLPGMYEQATIDEIPTDNVVLMRSAEAGRWVWPTADWYPVICKYLCYTNHHAIDLYAPTGTAIYAGRDGVVEQVVSTCPSMSANKKECGGGYGNYITIKHATGVYSRYAHLNSVDVKQGQKVSAGQKIGSIGTSGRVGAAHLHFEIRENTRGMANGGWNPLDSTRFNYVLPAEKNSSKVGWVKENNKWSYYKNNKKQTGWQKVDGVWYYLNSSGIMQTGWFKDGGTWYYLKSSGAMATSWEKVNGTWYYMNSSGAMLTGWQKVNGTWYYMNSSGAMLTGWLKDRGTWYYLNGSGAMLTGWQNVGGVRYYLNGSGAMLTGWQTIDGARYFMNGSGAMLSGWQTIGDGRYYLGSNGAMATGWQKISGAWYYFYEQGTMATNTEIDGWSIDANGVATKIEHVQDGWVQVGNDLLYYVDGVEQTGLVDIEGARYYFNENGIMQTGWQQVNQVNYYFYQSGKMATNTEIDGWTIDANGVATKVEIVLNGWQKIDGYWYYYVNNAKQTGWLTLGNDKYYLQADGKMISDDWLTQNNKKYYFAASGSMRKGWYQARNQWYYANQSGEMLTSGTVDGWVITPSGMAYIPSQINPDYVVNKSIDRLLELQTGFVYNPSLNQGNAKHITKTGEPGYEEALTEAVVVDILTSGYKQFNVYVSGNTAHIFMK